MSSTKLGRKFRESLKLDVEKLNRRRLTQFKYKQKMKSKDPKLWKEKNREYQQNYLLKKLLAEASGVLGYGRNVQALYAATTRAAMMMPRDKHKAVQVAARLAHRYPLPAANLLEPQPRNLLEPQPRNLNNSVDREAAIAFFNDDEVSRQHPGKNDTLFIRHWLKRSWN